MPKYTKPKKRKRGIDLCKIAGIHLSIDFSWFIIFALILWSLSSGYFPREYPGLRSYAYWLAGLIGTLLFFLSVVLHELAHSIMAIRLGINIPSITLFIFGGISQLSEEAKDPMTELKIAIVGPLSSFLLAFIFWIVKIMLTPVGSPLAPAVFGYLVWINIALGIFNLIPGFPLDGGRVLRAFIWWKTGSLPRATRWASDVGKGFAVTLMILGAFQLFAGILIGGIWLFLVGVFLRGVAESGYEGVMVNQALEGVHVGEVMIEDVVSVPPDLSITDLVTKYILRYGYKGYPVVKDGRAIGVVSLSNVINFTEDEQKILTVEEAMMPVNERISIRPQQSVAEAMRRMTGEDSGRLLVIEADRLAGMITKTGLLRFLEIKRVLHR
ncbi:MAG: site-2 protease family protein [Syntrophobacteraceae bacterium]